MTQGINLDNVAVVLNRPRISENVGSAARAMKNMGFSRLIVVDPENWDPNRAAMTATKGALGLVRNLEPAPDLATALAPFTYVVGTTARRGGHRKNPFMDPARLAEHLAPISQRNDVAILFGPEDRGLTNDELRVCHALLTIPTRDMSSLNLAQAVLLVCWELSRTTLQMPAPFVPRLACRHELDRMYANLAGILTEIGYIQKDNPDHWMDNIRRFFNRLPLTAREVKVILGFCRQMNWYMGKEKEAAGEGQKE
ncbi:MAG: RNA methyltransferase [Deltaproteobacteria bacterium]|nr:RNA methyltransferase [Deltaproteobacteria bacterium]